MLTIEQAARYAPQVVDLTRALVEIESPTDDKAAVERVGARLRPELEALGAQVWVETHPDAGDHLIAEWDDPQDGGGILTLCHMDTVYPLGTLARQPCVERGGRLYGPGTLDMKGGIALLVGALRLMTDLGLWPRRPLTALFTSDEETGSNASRELIERLAGRAALVLCLEASMPDGGLKTWRKGVGDYVLSITGRAAHAGVDPDLGRSAIIELAHQILAVKALADAQKGTTLNVGVVSGGTRPNVVAEQARAEIDLRVREPDEAGRVEAALRGLRPVLDGIQLEVSGGLNRPPMPYDARMAVTFGRAAEIAAGLGMLINASGTGGGSDANFVAPLGVPVLDGLGVQGEGGHSDREYLLLDSLPQRLALLAGLLAEW
jgi:glutamate carboxypeptidase